MLEHWNEKKENIKKENENEEKKKNGKSGDDVLREIKTLSPSR